MSDQVITVRCAIFFGSALRHAFIGAAVIGSRPGIKNLHRVGTGGKLTDQVVDRCINEHVDQFRERLGKRDVTIVRATMLRPSLSAGSPGHSISGSDRGSSALIQVCYHCATSALVIATVGLESGRFQGLL